MHRHSMPHSRAGMFNVHVKSPTQSISDALFDCAVRREERNELINADNGWDITRYEVPGISKKT